MGLKEKQIQSPGVLAVGNYDSNEGYAWRLMELFWCNLSQYMTPKGYDMHVCFASISTIPQCLQDEGFQVEKIDFTKSDLKSTLLQLKYLRKHKIKIIYFTDFSVFSYRYALYRLVGVNKIIVHDHTPGLRGAPRSLKKIIKVILARLPFISCDAAFAVSPYIEKRLEEVNCLPPKKIFCVTNGIDVGDFPPLPRVGKGKVRIATVGRITYYKGIDFAIETIAYLVKDLNIKSFVYSVFGDGPDLKVFQEMAQKYGVSEYIKFEGVSSKVAAELLECDIAFHPSRGEAMSLAILEYMRAGMPVVASKNLSVSSTLSEGSDAILYGEGLPKEAAASLSRLILSSEMRYKMGLAARLSLEENYTREKMIGKYLAAIESATK
jgi:glycosyltransferase involved in cell wall biosynthesis